MFTCRTCKLLKYSRAKRDVYRDENSAVVGDKWEANSIIDFLSEWYCPYYWWNIRPSIDFGCEYWQNMNGKHWI